MAQQNINFGTAPAGTDGDTLRNALQKVQLNTTDLYGQVAAAQSTASTALALIVGRNKLINGNFDIWQRGTSVAVAAATSAYLADRWVGNSLGGTTATYSQQSFTVGQTAVPYEPTYFMRHVVASVAGAANGYGVQQRIESIRTLAGQQATITFWAKADSPKNIAMEFMQFTGTTAITSLAITTFALTAAWAKYTATFNIPSIVGNAITTGSDFLQLTFWLDAGSSFNARTNNLGQQSGTFDFAQVQLEAGSNATPFELLPIGQTLALCQRFYEKSFPIATAPVQNFGNATGEYSFATTVGASALSRGYTMPFAVTKRAVPTITTYNPAAANSNPRDKTANTDCSIAGMVPTQANLQISITNSSSTAVGNGLGIHWVALAEF